MCQNALVVELAGDSEWFGFHPMLRELLLRRLELEQPGTGQRILHQRAARWFETHGDAVSAIRHACQARDWELVGHLLTTIAWPLALNPSGPALAAALEPAMARPCTARLRTPCWLPRSVTISGTSSTSMRRECDAAAKLLDDVPAADRVAARCLIGTLRIAHSRIVNPADTEGAAREQLSLLDEATSRPSPTAEHHRVIAINNLAVGQLWAGHLDQAAGNLLSSRSPLSRIGRPSHRTQRARPPGTTRRDPRTAAGRSATRRSGDGAGRSARMDK